MKALLDAALELANQGNYVFPVWGITSELTCQCGKQNCESSGKHPKVRWTKQSSKNPGRISDWFASGECNIGIDCARSGLLVLDVDPKNGGEASYQQLLHDVPDIKNSPTVKTGGGGWHHYFKNNAHLGSTNSKLGPGLDTRGNGGYVLAPPSSHKSGNRYSWLVEPDGYPDCPTGLVQALLEAKTSAKRKRERNLVEAQGKIPVGQRNEHMFSVAVDMRNSRRSQAEAVVMLCAYRDKYLENPETFQDAEVRAVVRSAYSYRTQYNLEELLWNRTDLAPNERNLLCGIVCCKNFGIPEPSIKLLLEKTSIKSKDTYFKARYGLECKGLIRVTNGHPGQAAHIEVLSQTERT